MTTVVKTGADGAEILIEGIEEKVPQGRWDGRSHDPTLKMFKAAYELARTMGIRPEDMPDLRSENGVLHAYSRSGAKLRLDPVPGWERSSGYVDMLISISARS
jgi:hypothetical protein